MHVTKGYQSLQSIQSESLLKNFHVGLEMWVQKYEACVKCNWSYKIDTLPVKSFSFS